MIRTVLLLSLILIARANIAAADMVLFQNGERRFGNAVILDSSDVQLETNGIIRIYHARQVRDVFFGVTPADILAASPAVSIPSSAELDDVTEVFIPHLSSGEVYNVTGANVYRKKLTTAEGRSYIVDVEEHFDVPIIQALPMQYGFFARQGTFLRAIIYNREDVDWNPISFRIFLYDEDDRLLSAKDVYVRRLPPTRDGIPQRRLVAADFPDIPIHLIHRLRFVRKF